METMLDMVMLRPMFSATEYLSASIPTNPSTPLSRLTLSSPLKPSRNLTVPSSSPPSKTSKISDISVVPPGRGMAAPEEYQYIQHHQLHDQQHQKQQHCSSNLSQAHVCPMYRFHVISGTSVIILHYMTNYSALQYSMKL